MTNDLEPERLLACLNAALAEADRVGHTLATAMITECIEAVRVRPARQ